MVWCMLCSCSLDGDKRRRKIHSSSTNHVIGILERIAGDTSFDPILSDAYLCRVCFNNLESIQKLREELFRKENVVRGQIRCLRVQGTSELSQG